MNPNDSAPTDSRDELGDRMKMYEHHWCYGRPYELWSSGRLTPGLPICVRIDGRAADPDGYLWWRTPEGRKRQAHNLGRTDSPETRLKKSLAQQKRQARERASRGTQ
jgi:hypothetical protein